MRTPTTSEDFDKAYGAPLTMWGDLRIPDEVKKLVAENNSARAIEIGCGIGRISRYMAGQGLRVIGVDFSPVAIKKAQTRVIHDAIKPIFIVDDVRDLSLIRESFDISVDVGCFHCLDHAGQIRYVAALARLLRPGAKHLMWVMDDAPGKQSMSTTDIKQIFEPSFHLTRFENKRRRFVLSTWFWLERRG